MKRTVWVLILALLPLAFSRAQRSRYERIEEHLQVTTDRPLEVSIEVDAGEVLIEPGEPESVDVFMRFTRSEFRHRIDFDEERNRLRISLDKESWWRKSGYDDETRSRVDIRLPSNVEMYFDAEVKAGEVELEMGGLRLREFYFRNLAGEVDLGFDEPNAVTMDFLDVNAKVGEMRLYSLGNARFEKADINAGIGEIRVDFSGALLDESRARVDLDIGEATILLPDDAGVRMEVGGGLSFLSHKEIDASLYRRGPAYYSDDYEDMERRFELLVTPGLGELNIER